MKIISYSMLLAALLFSTSHTANAHVPDPVIQKIVMQWDKNWQADMSPTLNSSFLKQKQKNLGNITELKAKLTELNLEPDFKNAQLQKLNQLIKNLEAKDSPYNDTDTEINFLNERIQEAIDLLDAISNSAKRTVYALQEMQNLAIKSANDVLSSAEREALNMKFQAYKRAMHYVQTVDLIAGEKITSGGSVTIQVGDEKNTLSTLILQLPRFDTKTLHIENLDIKTTTDALTALGELATAQDTMKYALVTLDTNRVNDVKALLKSIPSVLYQDYRLYVNSLDVILKSATGTASNADRNMLQIYFEAIKDTMRKAQTYVSLSGPKMLGGGDIHIQIGNENRPETTLDIALPITDIQKSGFEETDVLSQSGAYAALDNILKDLHDLVYGTKDQI